MPRRAMTTPQSTLSRRSFFGAAAGISLGLPGLRRFYGLDGPLSAPVMGFGPLVGFLYDATSSYSLGFSLQIGAALVAMLILSFVRPPALKLGTSAPVPLGAVPVPDADPSA